MTTQEIEALIKGVNGKMENLRHERAELLLQLKDAKQIEFEAKHSIKPGDKLTTKFGKVYYYDGLQLSFFGGMIVLCHPVKMDGTASKAVRQFCEEDFI